MTLLRHTAVLFAALMLAGSLFADDLESYKAEYEETFTSIVQEHGIALMDLEQNYVKALDSIATAYQKQADLDNIMRITREKERFVEERTVSPNDKVAPTALRKLQASYVAKLGSLDLKKARRIVALATQYDKALEQMQKDYTKRLSIDDATQIKNERDRIADSQEVTSATLMIADRAARSSSKRVATHTRRLKDAGTASELPRDVLDRLVLHYSFDSKGRKSITDRSRKNNNGFLHGPTYRQDGRVRGAYEFDGQDDYIEARKSEDLDVTKELTIAAWAHVKEFRMHGAIVCYGPDDNGLESFSLNTYPGPNRVAFRSNWPSLWYNLPTRKELKPQTWYHFAATFKKGEAKLYLNGEEENTQKWNLPELPLAPNRVLRIGENQPGSDEYFAGLIDEVMIFDKALSATEIKQLYDVLSAR